MSWTMATSYDSSYAHVDIRLHSGTGLLLVHKSEVIELGVASSGEHFPRCLNRLHQIATVSSYPLGHTGRIMIGRVSGPRIKLPSILGLSVFRERCRKVPGEVFLDLAAWIHTFVDTIPWPLSVLGFPEPLAKMLVGPGIEPSRGPWGRARTLWWDYIDLPKHYLDK
jgi:hypothetical protein